MTAPPSAIPDNPEQHRAFLNRYYGISRHFYDVTRKYYLFGRDEELRALSREDWSSLIEVGPGTGRNLRKLHRRRPTARFGGIEASDEMFHHARRRCPWAHFVQGFAESTDMTRVVGPGVDRALFSYCLSMVQDPARALANARAALSPGGEVVVVDFGDFQHLPRSIAPAMDRWLRTFHVDPVEVDLLRDLGATVIWGPGRYYFRARLAR